MQAGDVVAERFEIERLAGSGGMGAVYRARDRLTGEAVALKTLRADAGDFGRRFVREARVMMDLRHPAIVRYIAHGSTSSGELYLAMEWLEGQDLHTRLRNRGLTLSETLTMMTRIADALGAAHARGVVHRDIKPGNLFLLGDEVSKVKILDFGIAHQAAATKLATRTGALLGTPGYMAPEQARGDRGVDARADVFALGCVLYKCLTGRAPFAGEDLLAVAAKLLFEEPARVDELRPEVPRSIADLVVKMLSKNPAQRPANGAAVAAELEAEETLARGDDVEAPASRAGPGSSITATEQRLVCVVLAANLEDTGEGDEPTRTDESIATSWKRLANGLAPYGAHLERLVDGSVVASLSGKASATDQAAQAARCALAMRALLPRNALALATGRGVMAGKLPLGDVIDRAASMLRERREDTDPEGAKLIRVDDVTAGLLDARFDLVGSGLGTAPGASSEVLFLRGERDPLDATRTLLGRPTPCIGRERELGMLEVAMNECFSEPVARAVVITGAAGVGKSRLLHEFVRRVHQRGLGAAVWSSRGDPMSAGSPFGILGQALRRAMGVVDGEPAKTKHDKIRARVLRALPEADVKRVTAFVAELVGAPLTDDDDVQLRAARANPVLMGDQMQRAFEDFLTAECAIHPLLIVLEDLHWGDLPTVRFVDAALRNLHESPLMVLALGRPELNTLFPSLWVERSPTEMRLGELSRKASERLVREVLGAGLGADTLARIVERAGGNAFYLEELIRAASQGKSADLPETVLAMVQARLEELEPEARRVLRAASIFGQAFWIGGVTALLGGDEETSEVGEWLRLLAERELVVRRGDARFPGQLEYAFRHATVRDAAYSTFTDKDRELGHRLAGDWLERAGEPDALVLAEHFERGDERGRAAGWYVRACEQALEGNDFAAVLLRAEHGLACGATGEALGTLWLRVAEARTWRGENTDALAASDEAMRALPEASPLWYRAVTHLSRAAAHAGEQARLVEISDKLLSLRVEGDPRPPIAPICFTATHLCYAARYDLADALIARAEELAAEVGEDPGVMLLVLRAHGARAAIAGDLAESLRFKRLSVDAGEKAGDYRNACVERVNVGNCLTEIGAHEEAEVEIREAQNAAERMGLIFVVAFAKHNLGWAMARRGALAEGIAVEREAVDMFARQNNPRMESASRAYLSFMLTQSGDLEQAEHEAEVALAIVSGEIDTLYALSARADARLARGTVADALADAARAVEKLDELGGIDEGEAIVRLVHARALHAAGRFEDARAAIGRAEAHVRETANKINDAEMRERCLRMVPENAKTLELSREWLRRSEPTARP